MIKFVGLKSMEVLMRMKWTGTVVCLLLFFGLSGCAKPPPIDRQLGMFTVASTQNVARLKTRPTGKIRYAVKGQSCIEVDPGTLEYISGPRDNRIQRAMDEAIANGHDQGFKGDVLINVRVREKTVMVPPPKKKIGASTRRMECILVSGELVELE